MVPATFAQLARKIGKTNWTQIEQTHKEVCPDLAMHACQWKREAMAPACSDAISQDPVNTVSV